MLSYNRDKHDHLPELLHRKMTVALRRISELELKQRLLLEEYRPAEEAIGDLVADLRDLAASLSSRDAASGGTDLQNAIEMVGDSVRVPCTTVWDTRRYGAKPPRDRSVLTSKS